MVKVFIKETCFQIIQNEDNGSNDLYFKHPELLERYFLEYFIRPQNKQIIDIYTSFSWEYFLTTIKSLSLITAAGGLAINEKAEALWIFRKGLWDLPKGKVEIGEQVEVAAVREVEEECGVNNILNNGLITTTYHIYTHKSSVILKPTHWFAMALSSRNTLKPQFEEGIELVVWKNKEESLELLSKSYPSIGEVVIKAIEMGCF